MRFDELTLERYGAFERREMRFGPGLTVIYGPNEAGKSTALSAVGDFLFGVPDRSARGAIFGNDVLRLGASLTRSDGGELALRRRKGRARTLSDADGAAVDEAAISTLLGATTRDRFDTLFGLDHERLRRGGERLLAADGDIGRLIVEAGGGLRGLIDRLREIDQTLAGLFAPRKSGDRAFYKALDAFEAAEREVRAGLLTREAYDRAKAAHEAALAGLGRLREERRKLTVEASALDRVVRVVPLLAELDRSIGALEEFADLAPLPEAFDTDAVEAFAAHAVTTASLREAEATHASLAARLAGIELDPKALAAESQIRDAWRRGVIVRNARGDRAKRVGELTGAETQIDALRRLIGAGPTEDIAPRLPSPEAVEALRRLAAAALARRTERGATARRLATLEAQRRLVDDRIAAADQNGFGRSSGIAVADFANLSFAARYAAEAARLADAAAERARRAAEALGFTDAAHASALRLPSDEAIAHAVRRERTMTEAVQRQAEAAAAAEAARDVALAEIGRLRAGGAIATDAALSEARAHRDAAWAVVREAHRAGAPDPDATVRAAEAATLDGAIADADAIADRRTNEAQRAAALAQAERQRDAAEAALAAASRARGRLDDAARAESAALAGAFPEAVARAPTAAALSTLNDGFRTLIAVSERADAARAEAEAATRTIAPMKAALTSAELACGVPPPAEMDLGERVRLATIAARRHDEAYAERQRDARTRDEATAAIEAERAALAELDRADADWADAWAPALERLGLAAATSPDDAGVAANEWSGARGVLAVIRQSRERLAGMDRDEAELENRVTAIGAALDLVLPEDAAAGAEMLMERFKTADAAHRKRDDLTPDVAEAQRAARARADDVERCAVRLSELAASAGFDDADHERLRAASGRHAARKALRAERARAEAEVLRAGDGLTLDELRRAAGDRSVDVARADAGAARDRAKVLDDEVDDAVRAEHEARHLLDGHEAAIGVNRAVVLRESAIADLHDVAERYLELALARDLVEDAIARVRADAQDPLVIRAGALFAQATEGAFAGVAADVDDKGEPAVVGVRAGGGTVNVGAMSDGTRDQLYLAFRLASVESYCAAAEPLPLIVDDILVHFDDPRSGATLGLLADFGTVTQVLLFTHHLSVRRMAEDLGVGRCGVVDLG